MSSKKLTYDTVQTYKEAYIEENYTSLFSYATIKSFIVSSPWRCKEFLDDPELAQQFVNIFPQAKAEMSKFAMETTMYACQFVWSDAHRVVYSPEEEELLASVGNIIEGAYVPIEQRRKEPTFVYVPKLPVEMFDWAPYAEKLNIAASPESRGGLKLPEREIPYFDAKLNIKRIQRRLRMAHGGRQDE